MKLYLIIMLLVCTLELHGAKLATKKSPKIAPQSAIIAIQIIDPHENKTSLKNSKRTIESSLGYGYQGIFGNQQPRYETYKYSQHDIPPYTGPPLPHFTGGQSQGYKNPQPVHKPVQNFYQPGTILFSTINQRGQLGGLSQQFPVSLTNHQFPIPVIILRVHPDQLSNPVYPNLPQNHFLASAINSIDINSLLASHIGSSNVVKQPPQQQYTPQYEQPQAVQTYQEQPREEYGAPTSYQEQEYYPQYQYQDVQEVNQNYAPQEEVQVQVQPKYQYTAPSYHQAGPVNDFNSPELLTHENYPSDKHTQVVFKRSKKAKLASASKKAQHTSQPASKVPAAPQQSVQNELEQVPDPKEKPEAPPMYYTLQYSDDQQYVYRQDPEYNERSRQDLYSKTPETQDYVYVSRPQPTKH